MPAQGQKIDRPVTIVTGGSEGIGAAIVHAMAAAGHHVIALARREEPLSVLAAQLNAEGLTIETDCLDVADAALLAAMVRDVAVRLGRLDGLVNNAHYFAAGDIAAQPLASWQQHFRINCDAPFAAMQAAMPIMGAGGGGAIVNIGSISAKRGTPATAAYSASKAALLHLSAIAAIEGATLGVRVNSVSPGGIFTPAMQQTFGNNSAEEVARLGRSSSLLGRMGHAQEVASAVRFLLSGDARFITGEDLRVDGGAYWSRSSASAVSWNGGR